MKNLINLPSPALLCLPLIFSVFCLSIPQPSAAQQWPLQKQFRQSQSIFNPAAVNTDYLLYEYNATFQASYRTQWLSYPETPRTYHLSGEYLTSTRSNFEILTGANLMQDRTGPFGFTSITGRIGATFTRDPYLGLFSAAIHVGWAQYRIDVSRIDWSDPGDPNIPINNSTVHAPDLTLGFFYSKRLSGGFFDEDNIYAGFSIPQLMNIKNRLPTLEGNIQYQHQPHYFLSGGWFHFLNEEAYIEVASWLKYTKGAPFNLDLSFRLQPLRTLWVGTGFNTNGLLHLEGGVNIPGLFMENAGMRLGYSFDYNLSALGLSLGPSHEFTLGIFLDTYAQGFNPRF